MLIRARAFEMSGCHCREASRDCGMFHAACHEDVRHLQMRRKVCPLSLMGREENRLTWGRSKEFTQ